MVISLKQFLLVPECPAEWQSLDLYLLRDAEVVFYVGQSQLAFGRVWEHLLGGYKGHSMVGRFVWVNWPASMNFSLELFSSQAESFAAVGNEVSAAERWLIQRWAPCFNVALNSQPHALPQVYLPANAPFRRRRSLPALVREAQRAVQIEQTRRLRQALEEQDQARGAV